MKPKAITVSCETAVLAIGLTLVPYAVAENIDPASDDSQYAYAENIGWISAEPSGDGGPGIQVGDSELSGWMWAENIGWISLSCENLLTCATTDYRVLNDGSGNLSGYAWAENVGWIDFAPSTSGVTIDPATGEFSGYAWAENIGWISFNCANTSSCGTTDYKVKTGWICNPPPAAPSASPSLMVDKSGADALLSWDIVSGATGSDVVRGTLSSLRTSNGDFNTATDECLDDNRTTTSLLFAGTPPVGDGYWFLVRGQNCGGSGTYDTGEPSQVGLRNTEIAASGNDCTP
jgi:hypothetical protein